MNIIRSYLAGNMCAVLAPTCAIATLVAAYRNALMIIQTDARVTATANSFRSLPVSVLTESLEPICPPKKATAASGIATQGWK